MRRSAGTWAAFVALAITLGAGGLASAQGKGGGGGGGGGGGNAGNAAGALYGDLYVIERDGNGEPLTRTVHYQELDENGVPTGAILDAACNQPLAEGCGLLPVWAECDTENNPPVADDGIIDPPAGCIFNPELYDPCAVHTDFTDMLQPVAFGRESVSRSPASVLDSSYGEALKTINLAVQQCDVNGSGKAVKTDPAGRIMLCLATVEDDGSTSYAWKTIDAPLENLGMYRAVMTNGCLSPIDETTIGEEGQSITVTIALTEPAKGYLGAAQLGHLVCSTQLPEAKGKPDLLSAAVFIGAAADKSSPVTLDEIINLNTYLGINPYTYTRQGKTRTLTVSYFDFGSFDYVFGDDACRPETTAALLTFDTDESTFSTNTVEVFKDSPPGVLLRGPGGAAITVCRDGFPTLGTCDVVNQGNCGGANYFAQRAEDARKTIWYLHNWRVPEIAW